MLTWEQLNWNFRFISHVNLSIKSQPKSKTVSKLSLVLHFMIAGSISTFQGNMIKNYPNNFLISLFYQLHGTNNSDHFAAKPLWKYTLCSWPKITKVILILPITCLSRDKTCQNLSLSGDKTCQSGIWCWKMKYRKIFERCWTCLVSLTPQHYISLI